MARPVRSLTLVALGAAAAYLLDPGSGAERRRRVRARLGQLSEQADRAARPADATGAVPRVPAAASPRVPAPGTDTATGTDPAAKYTGPGYEDVSFGQATARDAELAERLVVETAGDLGAAEQRFGSEAVGSEVLSRRR